jgi:pimeloyl-ACP methyl ester carboxylesterase
MRKTIHSVSTSFQIINQHSSSKQDWILLHGWGCTWEIWSPLIQQEEKHRLLIPDLPAFGQSDEPKQTWTTRDYVDWLRAFIESECQNKPHLIGHSYGGKIAALFASLYPELIDKLVLVDASGLPDPLPQNKRLQEKLVGAIPSSIKNAIPNSLKTFLINKTGSSVDYLNASAHQKRMLKTTLKEDLSNEVQRVTAKTLIVWGEEDQDTPVHQAERYHQLISGSSLKIIRNVGHFPFVDQPKEFLSIVNAFL